MVDIYNESKYKYTFVSWDEAQELKAALAEIIEVAPYKEAKESAKRILAELDSVRNVDYSPLPGYQLTLGQKDYEFLQDIRKSGIMDRGS